MPIAPGTSETYVPVAEDVGHTLRLLETTSNAGGSSEPAESQASGAVLPLPPADSAPPTITGIAQQGQTLVAAPGVWKNEPSSFSYQWLRCDRGGASCGAIPGASAATYTLGSTDLGGTLRVSVTAWNPAGPSTPVSSGQTAVVAGPPAEQAVGRPKFRLDAASYFDPYAGEAAFLQAHVARILAYPTFGDRYLATGIPIIAYHDYWTSFTQQGKPLSDPANRAAYVALARRDAVTGYRGQFMDDANMAGGNIPGSRPDLATLTEEVRAAIGPTGVLEWNAQYHDLWPLMKAGDPDVARALAQVNIVTKEFGVGPTSGIGTASDYAEFLQYVDTLHAKGIHVTMTGDHNSTGIPTMEYNLATYLLANDGRDFVNGSRQTPAGWWAGFNVNLGEALTPRERSPSGLWTRTFSGGVAYTVEPGAATQTIRLARPMYSPQFGSVESVTLAAGQGAVLIG